MSRVQLALRVADLETSIEFYSTLFGVALAKRRPGYANFAIPEPPLKLVLLEGQPGQATVMDHLGVEVDSSDEVNAATKRLTGAGLDTLTEDNTTCGYAVQDKVWIHGPGQEPWEVYAVKADSVTYGTDRTRALGRLLHHQQRARRDMRLTGHSPAAGPGEDHDHATRRYATSPSPGPRYRSWPP